MLEIRALRAEDFAAWRMLWAEYNAFYGREGETALPRVVVETTLTRPILAAFSG